MKTSIPLFFAGLAIGVAGMLALGPRPAPPEVDSTGTKESDPPATASANPGPAEGKAKRKAHSHRHRGRRGSAQDALDEILLTLSSIDDEQQLDPMRIIRQAMRLTRLGETEAIDLLHQLNQPPSGETNHDEREIRAIVGLIVFSRLCELNGPEAMRMASDGILGDDMKDEFIAIGMNSWIAADPEGAQRWFEGLVDEADTLLVEKGDEAEPGAMIELLDNDDLRTAYFNGMAKHDPDALEERISRFESDEVREVMREDMMASLIARENTAQGLLEILGKSGDLPDSRVSAIEKLAMIDVETAAEWVTAQPADKTRDHEVTVVATRLMDEDPDNGAKWFMNQEIKDPEMAKNRMSRITYRLANENFDKAVDWVNRQPDSPVRDHAEIAVAWLHAKQDDWRTSMTWLADVSDRQTRETTLNQMFRNNWDKAEQSLRPELLTAAEAAGFGRAARSYTPE